MSRKKWILGIVAVAAVAVLTAGSFIIGRSQRSYQEKNGSYTHIRATDSFGYVEKHPAFAEFSEFIIPWKDTMNRVVTPHLSMQMVCAQNKCNVDSILDGFNFAIDKASEYQLYHSIYSEKEISADPEKKKTGLLFFKGDVNKPVVLLVPGGGYTSVCIYQEGFPVAKVLQEKGYNVFILKYRVDETPGAAYRGAQEVEANADFGKAMQYIFENQEQLGVNPEGYSAWGFSAGGRTTFLWGLSNEYGYQNYGVPAPASLTLVYSGWYDEAFADYYDQTPPTFFAWLPNDDVIGKDNAEGIERYIEFLQEKGITVDEKRYYKAKHGFGEGRGSDAEGWIEYAVEFWENQRGKM